MSEQWKWQIGVDSEPAEQAFDQLERSAIEADGALDKIVASLGKLETAFETLNKSGGFGDVVAAINIWGEAINESVGGVAAKLASVQGTISRIGRESRDAARESATGWSQATTPLERYTQELTEAEIQLGKMRHQAEAVGMQYPTMSMLPGGQMRFVQEKAIAELIPSMEEYKRLLGDIEALQVKERPYPETELVGGEISEETYRKRAQWEEETARIAQRKWDAMAVGSAEAEKYVGLLREIAQQEGVVAQLVELEARERQKAVSLAQQQAAAAPEGQLASFFTERGETEWSAKYGLGEMTGFEQSLLRVLTTFDQLQSTATETQVTFTSLIQVLETIGQMRFQALGTSLRTNLRDRLEESAAAALTLLNALERVQSTEIAGGPGLAVEEAVRPETPVSYWAGAAGAPYAEIASSVTDIGDLISSSLADSDRGAEEAAGRIRRVFEQLKTYLVSGSLVPDMVNEINMWLSQIGGMGSLQGIEGIGQKFLEVQRQMQQAMLWEQGGLPGFGEQRQEFIDRILGPYRESLQQAHGELSTMFAQASTSQWQQIQAPTGQAVHVPPAFVTELAGKETERFQQQIQTLTSSEEELTEAAMRTARSLFEQGKAARTKADILRDLRAGTINAAQADEELEKMNKRTQGEMEKTSALSNRFLRHITWIFQGIVIWGAIRAMQEWVQEFNEGYSQIEASAAHAAFIVEASTERMMQAQREYAVAVAQYGVGPTEAAPVLPLAERYGMSDPRIAELSAQLAMVSDEEMSMAEASTNLMSVMRQWNITIDESSRVLDTLATMYANTPGTMKEFMDLMREGPALAKQMGQSFEENMLLISRAMSYLPGRTATTVSGTLGRMLSRIYRQDAARQLAQEYGISVYDPETLGRRPGLEVLDEIAQKFQMIKSESEKAALAEMVAGTRQGQAWRDAYVMLTNWTEGVRGAQTEMRDFDNLVDNMSDTHKTALEEMTASWSTLIQVMGQTSGILGMIDDGLRNISDIIQDVTREQELMYRAEQHGFQVRPGPFALTASGTLAERYRQETGAQPYMRTGLGQSATEEFLDWIEDFLSQVQGGRGSVPTAGERGWDPSAIRNTFDESSRSFADMVRESGQGFRDNVENASDSARRAILTSMLATGWTPGTGIVDLSEYSMAEINRATRQSSQDTQRMIAAYRQFLQDEGFGGEAIESAMAEFTNKLMLQLQFFRLPGNQIRLMEGRDLLFYLSQIEENTRPLEGIWNVPEGMRVWVPIESTFYGEWRNRQQEGEEGEAVKLDASEFDGAVQTMGMFLQDFNAQNRSVWENMRLRFTSQEEGGTAPAGAGETLWDARVRDYFTLMQWLQEGREGRPTDYLGRPEPTEGADPAFWERFGSSVDAYAAAVDRFAASVDAHVALWEPVKGPVQAVGTATAGVGSPEPYDTYLPIIMKGIMDQLYPEVPLGPTEIELPEPIGVNVSPTQMAQGVAMGTVQTGMPVSMMAMTQAQAAQASATTALIYYLMVIANNTAQPATTTVLVEGGTATTTTTPTTAPASGPPGMMTDWYLGGGSGVVPT
ncbi:MAG: phage tail tape measure protein [Deltaproteobacteria bacterium]|nr:phage tail tape measure protein [Deltaproteobacteria bacterium]